MLLKLSFSGKEKDKQVCLCSYDKILQKNRGNVSIISGKLQKGWLFTLISLTILKALKTGYIQTGSNMNLKHLFHAELEADTISANISLLRGHFAYCIATNMTPGSSYMKQTQA